MDTTVQFKKELIMDTINEYFVIKNLKDESPFEDAFAENSALPTLKKPPTAYRPSLKLVFFYDFDEIEGNIQIPKIIENRKSIKISWVYRACANDALS